MNQKLTIDEQINLLKSKNILFNIMNEDASRDYLTYKSYYHKLKDYAHSFEYNNVRDGYIHLEFAYMVELYELDMCLKDFLGPLVRRIEDILKTILIRDLTNNSNEDGYDIIVQLFIRYPYIENNIIKRNPGNLDLTCQKLSAWKFIDLATLGEFSRLLFYYYEIFPDKKMYALKKNLWSLKHIRDDVAHDNALLADLRNKNQVDTTLTKSNNELFIFISRIPGIAKSTRKSRMKNVFIHDFISILYLFNAICIDNTLKKRNFLYSSRINEYSLYCS